MKVFDLSEQSRSQSRMHNMGIQYFDRSPSYNTVEPRSSLPIDSFERGKYFTLLPPIASRAATIGESKDCFDLVEKAVSNARHGRVGSLKKLLNCGMNVECADEFGNTLLIIAAQNGNKKTIQELLRRGADLNAQNGYGQTALHFCFMYEFRELANYLISKGADSKIVNIYGLDCFHGLKPSKSMDPTCSICLDDVTDDKTRTFPCQCKKIYHDMCYKKWVKRSPSCPTCRLHLEKPDL